MNMKMRYLFLNRVLSSITVMLSTFSVHAAEPKIWDVAYAKESPLDAAVATLLSEVSQPTSRPAFAALKQLYGNSYASVPAIRKTRAQLNGLTLAIEEKESKLYPQVSLETNSGRSTVDSSSRKVNDNARTTTLEVEQLLYDFDATSMEIEISEARLSSGVQRVAAERLEVILSMTKAQLDLQSAKKLVVFYDANEKSRQQFFDLIKQKVVLGASSRLDLARAETMLLEAKAKMPGITGELFRSESAVKEFFGIVPDFSFSFYQLPGIAVNFAGNIDAVVSRHPSVLEAVKNFDIARKEVARLRSAALGRITLTINSTGSTQPATGKVTTTTGYIGYSNTLFDGFAQKSRVGAALAKALEFEIEQERVERKIRQQLLTTLTEYQSAKETLEVRGNLLRSAGKSARDLYTAFLLNRGSLSDVFEAEERYFTAAEATVNAMTSLHRSYYKLLHDAGQLSDAFELNS
jgi:outer membrane protein TolC